MIAVDTNVLVYLLIEGDRTKEAQALLQRDSDWRSDSFLLIEFTNVLATYSRIGALTAPQAASLLAAAEQHLRGLVAIPHSLALQTAHRFGISAYDARFIAAAQGMGVKLVTEDARLRDAVPALTMSLAQALI